MLKFYWKFDKSGLCSGLFSDNYDTLEFANFLREAWFGGK